MMEVERVVKKLQNRVPDVLGNKDFSKFAVLLPLIKKENEIHVLFEVRSLQLRRQPGEICFPGGKIDQTDRDTEYTAIRETSEELGIPVSSITNIFPLDYMVSPFGSIIYPYIGLLENTEQMQPNPSEVEEIFTVPLDHLRNIQPEVYKLHFKIEPEEHFPFDAIVGGKNYNWQVRGLDEYFYYYEDRVIWGLTARILAHFLEILDEK